MRSERSLQHRNGVMSLSSQTLQTRQNLRRQKLALTAQLRQNFWLKLVSLIASVLLYVFVQADHNPVVTRPFVADIVREHLASDIEAEWAPRQITVNATGPRSILDRIKDSDVHAYADFQNRTVDTIQKVPIPLRIEVSRLPAEMVKQLVLEPNQPILLCQLYPQSTHSLTVSVMPKAAPTGFHYERLTARPSLVEISGREDRVQEVARLRVSVVADTEGKIDGQYAVSAQDKDGKRVEGISLSPASVRVQVSLIADPPAKYATISPDISTLPLPPYSLVEYDAVPGRVKIIGTLQQLDNIFTIQTEKISLRDMKESGTIEVDLLLPDNVTAQDLQGNAVVRVKVHITMHKTPVASVSPPTMPDVQMPPPG